ncbi:MAG: YraN family protein [Planctomycetota bacterium]
MLARSLREGEKRVDGRSLTGRRGEAAAARYLRRRGYRIVGRNVRVAVGEVDLLAIAPGERRLVIVEVKARSAEAAGPEPELRVGAAKRRKLVQVAQALLKQRRFAGYAVRFDVVGVDLPPVGWRAWVGLERAVVRHHVGAFVA